MSGALNVEIGMPYFQTERSTSPIEHLSQDLLIQILDMLHDSFDDDPSNLGAWRSRAQVYVTASHVSRFWRFMALENPLWWSKIDIRLPWMIKAINDYLTRSKNCLLELEFSGYDHIFSKDSPSGGYYSRPASLPLADYQRLLDLLVPHFHRCRILKIRGLVHEDDPLPFSSFEHLLDTDMPYLEELILEDDLSHYMQELSKRRFRPFFSSSPALRTLGLHGVDFRTFYYPSPSLTTLQLCQGSNTLPISFKDFKVILESCPLLNTLAVYNELLDPPAHSTVEVPVLENLYILANMLCISDLLLFLRAPKLKSLTIVPMVISDLQGFMTAGPAVYNYHFASLQSLTLAPVNRENYISVEVASACFPFVERLILINMEISACVDFLSIKGESKIAFPNLKELGLTKLKGVENIKAIHDVARNRVKHNFPLRKIYLDAEAFECYSVLDVMDEEDQNERVPSNLVEGNDLWEPQRRKLLFSKEKDMFI